MDDYQKEIADLELQVEQLVEAEGDAKTIAELSMQLEILRAIYSRALDLLGRGQLDDALRYGLRIQGYGEWTLDNVYAFVFETAVDLPDVEPTAFVKEVSHTDFARLLIAS